MSDTRHSRNPFVFCDMSYQLGDASSSASLITIDRYMTDDFCISNLDLDEKPIIKIFGRSCHQQRNIGFFSSHSIGYQYSGQVAKSRPLTDAMSRILDQINIEFHQQYNGILINHYVDGSNYISAHSDDEKELGRNNGVIALSFGAPRLFRVRDRKTREIVKEVETSHGQLLIMNGNFQSLFTHEIPKQLKIKEYRTSLTFRNHCI